MAHRSRLAGFIIDCQVDELPPAVAFWSQALGYPVKERYVDDGTEYTSLAGTPAELHVELDKMAAELAIKPLAAR